MTWGRRQTLGASVFSSAKWKRNSPSHPYPPWAVVRRYESITRVKSDSEHYTVNISKYLLQHRSLLWEPRVVQRGRVFGEPLCGPKQGLARMKPQQTPWPEVRWGWHSSPGDHHTGLCVKGGVVHTCHPGPTVGASHRLCHFLICHEKSKALTGLLAPILQGSLRQFPQRSVTMGHN